MIFCMIVIACGSNNNDKDEYNVKDPSELEEGENTTLTGMVSWYFDGDLFFTLTDNETDYKIFISGDEDITMGEYVQVVGEWDKINDALVANNIKKLSENEKIEYLRTRFPILEIEILEYPKNIAHTCETPKFKFKLTNTGINTVSHKDLHTYDYDYGFYYFINEDWSRANADREDYTEVESNIKKDELSLIGFLSNQGFMYFEDIKPGESREVEYWAGGQVTKNEFGTAGSPNIFGNYEVGEHDFSFAWADKNNYDPIFFFKSDSVKIKLNSDECDLGV